jgi:ABC-type antimicrobial peptide transport system permease subunit
MALGAQRRDVMILVLFHGAALGFLGVGMGIVAAFLLTRLMTALLYGVAQTIHLPLGRLQCRFQL